MNCFLSVTILNGNLHRFTFAIRRLLNKRTIGRKQIFHILFFALCFRYRNNLWVYSRINYLVVIVDKVISLKLCSLEFCVSVIRVILSVCLFTDNCAASFTMQIYGGDISLKTNSPVYLIPFRVVPTIQIILFVRFNEYKIFVF